MDKRENGEQGWAYCVIHDVVEEDRPGDYKACLECGHVYRTPGDLTKAAVEQYIKLNGDNGNAFIIRLRDIHACPLCGHDF